LKSAALVDEATMTFPRVVILSDQSLFTEGIASRLRDHMDQLEMVVIDPRGTDVIEQMALFQPSSVIMDASDSEVTNLCPLNDILMAVPEVKVLRLDPQQDQIQVVTSEQKVAGKVQDLVDVIMFGE
jgi:DNA-binding NarL/FixJ family response regulator